MRRRLTMLVAVLLVAGLAWAEPVYQSISASQTVGSTILTAGTQEVLIISDGANTCYFRLFTDADTVAAATTSYLPIKSGESLSFTHRRHYNTTNSRWSTYFKTISAICGTGETATLRVYSQQGEVSRGR